MTHQGLEEFFKSKKIVGVDISGTGHPIVSCGSSLFELRKSCTKGLTPILSNGHFTKVVLPVKMFQWRASRTLCLGQRRRGGTNKKRESYELGCHHKLGTSLGGFRRLFGMVHLETCLEWVGYRWLPLKPPSTIASCHQSTHCARFRKTYTTTWRSQFVLAVCVLADATKS